MNHPTYRRHWDPATGLEARLYPDRVELTRWGAQMFVMTPQEYGEVMRWIDGELREIAAAPWGLPPG